MINSIVLLAGMMMDFIPNILIFTPVFMPVIHKAGIDPVFFGVIFILNCAIGLITPPVGNVLNAICGVRSYQHGRPHAEVVAVRRRLRGCWCWSLRFFPGLVIVPLHWLI